MNRAFLVKKVEFSKKSVTEAFFDAHSLSDLRFSFHRSGMIRAGTGHSHAWRHASC